MYCILVLLSLCKLDSIASFVQTISPLCSWYCYHNCPNKDGNVNNSSWSKRQCILFQFISFFQSKRIITYLYATHCSTNIDSLPFSFFHIKSYISVVWNLQSELLSLFNNVKTLIFCNHVLILFNWKKKKKR